MSQQPGPPRCIAKALDTHLGNLLTVREKRSAARAVWDALLAEGHVYDFDDLGPSLVIPLPVVEARSAT